jgi:large subunit ribosomal protein L3
VLPGMRAAGHLGNARITVRQLRVVRVLDNENLLVVEGAIPGRNGGYVIVKKA